MAELAAPEEVVERVLGGLDVALVGRCASACALWSRAAAKPSVWAFRLARGFGKQQAVVTERGISVWLARELGGDVPVARGHLRRLQESRQLRDLFRFLHAYHGCVEIEPHGARRAQFWGTTSSVNLTVTLELLNLWPHSSWVLIRSAPPPGGGGDGGADDGAGAPGPPEASFEGSTVMLRCWDSALLPQGRLGQGFCHLLDCGIRGELFRLGPLATLEVGSHRLRGHVEDGRVRLECLAGRWPDEPFAVPLAESSRDAFLHTTTGAGAPPLDDEDPSGLPDVAAEWFEGRRWPEGCSLGPVLFQTTLDLEVSQWI